MTNSDAYLIREVTGTTSLVETARTVASILADNDIPHLFVGGLAVQEHGYPRLTIDVDVVVPDVIEAVEFLTANLTGPLYRLHGVEDRIEDRRNKTFIDLLEAGKVLKRGCKVPFPAPKSVAEKPQIISLEDLISLKLDSWVNSPLRRHKDKTDVIELIKYRNLPRNLAINPVVLQLYLDTWDALASEK